jgi:hypothetical protein
MRVCACRCVALLTAFQKLVPLMAFAAVEDGYVVGVVLAPDPRTPPTPTRTTHVRFAFCRASVGLFVYACLVLESRYVIRIQRPPAAVGAASAAGASSEDPLESPQEDFMLQGHLNPCATATLTPGSDNREYSLAKGITM